MNPNQETQRILNALWQMELLPIAEKFRYDLSVFFCHFPQYLTYILFENFEVLVHVSTAFPHTGQDYWIPRKNAQQ